MNIRNLIRPKIICIEIGLLMLFACKRDVTINPLNDLPDEMLLSIPTYDGSGQGVHPDILFLDPPLQGNRFMLAFTPYPYYNAYFENPSILVSKNGIDFSEPIAGINPLVPPPAYDHNDDPDLLFDKKHQKFYLHYLQTMRPDSENIIRLESKDGITWAPNYAVHFDLKNGDPFIVSPTIVQQLDGVSYRMYYVNLTGPSGIYKIQTLYSADGINWDKNLASDIHYDLAPPVVPWHLDVLKHGTEYVMLASCRNPQSDPQHQLLMMGTSTNGLDWHFRQKPLMYSTPDFHGCLSMYRSAGLIYDNILAVWYSMDDTSNEWKIGIKKFNMDTL